MQTKAEAGVPDAGQGTHDQLTRRDWLKRAGTAAAAAFSAPVLYVPRVNAQARRQLRIIQWSHFVPAYDVWFDQYAKQWGQKQNPPIEVTVDHISFADVVPRANAEVAAQEGHDLFMFLAPPGAFEPEVLDMGDLVREAERRYGPIVDLAKRSTYNPVTGKWFGFSEMWVPDPGDYLYSVWSAIGMPNGPSTWQDLLTAGREIRRRFPEIQIPIGIGYSQDIDSNMATRAILWSFDAAIQDEEENVVLRSDQAREALEFGVRLFRECMSPAVLSWNAASNNQAFNARQTAYILNSISAYRTAQDNRLPVADDTYFVGALRGPRGTRWASEHVMSVYVIWRFARNPDAAKQFLLDLLDNYRDAVMASKLYNFPSFFGSVADRNVPVAQKPAAGQRWMEQLCDNDPFGSRPPNKLAPIKDAVRWSTNVGHPGPANPAIGEIFDTFVIPDMFAKAATGTLSVRDALEEAHRRCKEIFEKWRRRGLVAGGSRDR